MRTRETLARLLKNSAAVTFTSSDYEQLFIHKDKTTKPHSCPSITPKVDVVGRQTGIIKIQLSDPALPEFNHRSLPNGVSFANIFVAIAIASAAIPIKEDYHLFVTESTIDLSFGNEDEKKVAYIKAQFSNSTGRMLLMW